MTVGFGATGLPWEARIRIVFAVFIETEENPARRPPTRVETRGGASFGAGAAGFGAGATAKLVPVSQFFYKIGKIGGYAVDSLIYH